MPTRLFLGQADQAKLESKARWFAAANRWIKPRFATGHLIAHHDAGSQAKNWSTITRIIDLSDGRKVYLVYRYALSWMHALLDNSIRILCGRHSWKCVTRRGWQKRFERKSRIRLYELHVPGVVAMEYVHNRNLWDVLVNNFGNLSYVEVERALADIVRQVNEMHAERVAWADLIVNNLIIRSDTGGGVICDTEVGYLPWVSTKRQQVLDWRDFIFSVCGAWSQHPEWKDRMCDMAQAMVMAIRNSEVRNELIRDCRKHRLFGDFTFWQYAWFAAFGGQLSQPSRDVYRAIRQAIAGVEINRIRGVGLFMREVKK